MNPELHRKRCKRRDIPFQAHYLTFSCFHRQPFLSRDRACLWFIDAILSARQKHPFDLWAWVFMPEHAHLLIWPHEGTKISPLLKSLKQPVTQTCVAWVRRNAPQFLDSMMDAQPNGKSSYRFWQRGGGYDRNIRSARESKEKIRYIHMNPVRRKLVTQVGDWPWSSARAWETGVDDPLPIDRATVPAAELS